MAAYGKGIRLVRRYGKHGPVQNRNKGHKIEGFQYGHTVNGGPWIDGDPVRKGRKGKASQKSALIQVALAKPVMLPERFRRKAAKTAAVKAAVVAPKPKRKYTKSKPVDMTAVNAAIEQEVTRRVKAKLSKVLNALDFALA